MEVFGKALASGHLRGGGFSILFILLKLPHKIAPLCCALSLYVSLKMGVVQVGCMSFVRKVPYKIAPCVCCMIVLVHVVHDEEKIKTQKH